jgi:hypothetical protein
MEITLPFCSLSRNSNDLNFLMQARWRLPQGEGAASSGPARLHGLQIRRETQVTVQHQPLSIESKRHDALGLEETKGGDLDVFFGAIRIGAINSQTMTFTAAVQN